MTSLRTELTIRRATLADAALLAQLNHQLIRDEGHRNSMSLTELRTRMEDWLAGEYFAIMAQREGDVLGYALYRETDECLDLRQLFVRPDARRQGVGRTLVNWIAEHVCQPTARLRIDVLVGNPAGIAFWRALGFEEYCLTMERNVSSRH